MENCCLFQLEEASFACFGALEGSCLQWRQTGRRRKSCKVRARKSGPTGLSPVETEFARPDNVVGGRGAAFSRLKFLSRSGLNSARKRRCLHWRQAFLHKRPARVLASCTHAIRQNSPCNLAVSHLIETSPVDSRRSPERTPGAAAICRNQESSRTDEEQ